MRAGELCIRDVVTALADESVVDAARRMSEFGVGNVIVIDKTRRQNPRPLGIVTDRDLVVQVLARPERVPGEVKLAEVMRGALVVAHEDEDVEGVIAKMRTHGVRRIPIVDYAGHLQGILSADDILSWMRDQLQATTKAIEPQLGLDSVR